MKLFEIKNSSPSWLLMEGAEDQATHLEHLEDEIFNKGYWGALEAFNYINSVRAMLSKGEGEASQVTVKWDGAPAIHCGIDPVDGKFFVGTKSVFAKTEPKLCKTSKDIKNWYGEDELARKLDLCLKYLPKLGIGGVVKGDLLFTNQDLQEVTIDGQMMLACTPNTLTYTTPIDSELAKKWRRAKIGIVFHTVYDWDPPSSEDQEQGKKTYANVPEMTAKFGFRATGLQPNPDVWFDDAYYNDYTGIASLTPQENQTIISGLNQVAGTLMKIDPAKFDKFLSHEFGKYVKPFINSVVKSPTHAMSPAGTSQVNNPIEFLKDFMQYVRNIKEKEINDLQTKGQQKAIEKGNEPDQAKPEPVAIQNRRKEIENMEKFIADNSNTLLGILAVYKKAVELKLELIKKLQQIEGIAGTFIKTDNGYKVTKPEGFVAVGHDGTAVKLVDRIVFSRENFLKPKSWQKGPTT
jgi:hypothetical protein